MNKGLLNRIRMDAPMFFMEGEGAGGGGGSAILPPEVMDKLNALVTKTGGADATNVLLFNENKELRDKNRELKAKVPADGTITATQADLDELAAYRELGKADELKAAVTERDELKNKVTQADRAKARDEAVKISGYDPEKFGALALAGEYDYSTKDGVGYATKEVDGKPVTQTIAEVIAERAAGMDDVLKAGAQGKTGQFVKQGVAGAAPNVFERIRQQAQEKTKADVSKAPDLRLAGIT